LKGPVMHAFGKSNGGGRRKAGRENAPLLAVLSTVSGDHRAAVVDISTTGARLSAPELPAQGEDLIFRADCLQAFGHVVWSKDGECGIEFESPVTAASVELLRAHANAPSLLGLVG
jgi:PilZ domain